MLHLNHPDLYISNTQTFRNCFPLIIFYFFNKLTCPFAVNISIDVRNEQIVRTSNQIITRLRGKQKKGVISIEDLLSIRDEKRCRLRNNYLIFFNYLFIQDDRKENLICVLELAQLLIIFWLI